MNRRTWWTALMAALGIAQAQQFIGMPTQQDRLPNGQWVYRPPKPNQCPVCGTVAKPLSFPLEPSGVYTMISRGADGRHTSLTRCQWCNCAFWQDEEPTR